MSDRGRKHLRVDPLWLGAGTFGEMFAVEPEHEREPQRVNEVLAELLQVALDKLQPEHREALVCVAVGGLSYGQAGKVLDRNRETVYRHAQAAIEQVRAELVSTGWMAELLAQMVPALADELEDDGE